jgi:hypothetical protein
MHRRAQLELAVDASQIPATTKPGHFEELP